MSSVRPVSLNGRLAAVALALLLAIAGMALAAPQTRAASFYVSPDGSDSRSCDLPAAPCATVTHALTRAQSQAGTHVINLAARHGGKQAVYRESIRVRQGAAPRPKVIIDGSWGGNGNNWAMIAPKGAGPTQVISLERDGAELRRVEVNSRQATAAAAAIVLDHPGSGHRLSEVTIHTKPGDVAVVVNSRSARLQWVTANAKDAPALDYGAPGEPVLVQDSELRQSGNSPVIRGSGISSLIFRRSVAGTGTQTPRAIVTEVVPFDRKRIHPFRGRMLTYDELVARDKASLDIFWLKDASLADLDNLPEPDDLAEEIIENIEAGLDSFRAILASFEENA